jgi:hypothetical protein
MALNRTFLSLRKGHNVERLNVEKVGTFLSGTKKTVIVDVVIVNSVMWAEGVEKG